MTDLSPSEMQGLLALGARKTLRGDRRTDAKAGTIHAPTAGRLCLKGLAFNPGMGKEYAITPAGKAALPGAETLAATKAPKAKHPDRKPAVLVPASELPDAWKPFDKAAEDAQSAVSKASRVPSPMVNGKNRPPSDVDAPSLVQAALAAPIAEPPVLAPPKPAEPVRKMGHTIVNSNAFEALCETGSIVVELSDGRARINAVGAKGRGFEFWIMRAKAAGWARLPLGNAVTELDGAKVVDTTPMPGKLPFAPIPPNEREAIA